MRTILLTLTLLTACTPKTEDDTGDTDTGDTGDTGDTDTGDTGHTDETGETGDTDTGDTGDTSVTTVCPTAGLYGDPNWSLDIKEDCSAFLEGFCGEGSIARLDLDPDSHVFSVSLTWMWQGAGPSGGEDPATLSGTISSDVVDGTLTWGGVDHDVLAELGVPPGTGLGLSSCPLD